MALKKKILAQKNLKEKKMLSLVEACENAIEFHWQDSANVWANYVVI